MTKINTSSYVQWFRQSSPYISAHRDKTFVIVCDGEALEHAPTLHWLQDIALLNGLLGVRVVLVHGARPHIDAALNEQGTSSVFHHGLRVTDATTLRTVHAVIGQLRATIEARLSTGLPNAQVDRRRIRVAGGNFVVAKPLGVIDGVDYQHTGEVRRIDHDGISQLLDGGNIVLLSSHGYSPSGESFNLPAEQVAERVAIALAADKLIVLSKHGGIKDASGQTLKQLTCEQLQTMQASGIENTLSPMARTALNAVKNGVERAHLLDYLDDDALLHELFTLEGRGTLVMQSSYDQLRGAQLDDVAGILQLLEPLEAEGVLVKRSREHLEHDIDRFVVIERDGLITACAALYLHNTSQAELACVAVHPDYQGGARGQRLLAHIEQQAKAQGIEQLFVLTTRTADWFVEQGFTPSQPNDLPAEKQPFYNGQRNSKVFIKPLTHS